MNSKKGIQQYDAFNDPIIYEKFNFESFYKKCIELPCFYVISPMPCKTNCDIGFKIGKATLMEQRLKSYQTIYSNFKIHHIRTFSRAKSGQHFRNDDKRVDLNTNYETLIKQDLKKRNIAPIRGNEIYANINDIKQSMKNVDKHLDSDKIPLSMNKISKRVLEQTKRKSPRIAAKKK
jgi:hypothetical protein